jgi:hypothetical protein
MRHPLVNILTYTTMKPTEFTRSILASFSFLGELASVMKQNNVPLKKEGRISSSKTAVNQGAQVWDCTRNEQARLMLSHYGKETTVATVTSMELAIESHNAKARAGYAIEKAFATRIDALHKSFKDVEAVVSSPPVLVESAPVTEGAQNAEAPPAPVATPRRRRAS